MVRLRTPPMLALAFAALLMALTLPSDAAIGPDLARAVDPSQSCVTTSSSCSFSCGDTGSIRVVAVGKGPVQASARCGTPAASCAGEFACTAGKSFIGTGLSRGVCSGHGTALLACAYQPPHG